ncbi:MAG: DUF4115 domain-containing protein [Selenomonadaceae bacterium]|nr:DUF4115 domain-containing protein [Selenomonadaceae bacterium]MBR1858075.1 DUF4115 domain-containing protein [Selenomonadaceae bacterium]
MVGDILRQERERQNLTIKDIEHGTSIRAVYIEAIENGDYEKLPGNVYTKGFIKNYGNFLKIDGDSLSRQFTAEIAPPSPSPVVQQNEKSVSENGTTDIIDEPIPDINDNNNQTQNEPTKIKYNNRSKSSSNTGLVVAAVILIAAIAGGLWYYFTNIEGKELAQNPPVQTEQQNPESSSSSSSATPASAQTPSDNTNVPASNFDGVQVQAKFTDKCWTKVIADGQVIYEGIPEPGAILSWQAKDRISVTAGNAGAVEFIENGNSIGVAGNVGAVVEKTFVRK